MPLRKGGGVHHIAGRERRRVGVGSLRELLEAGMRDLRDQGRRRGVPELPARLAAVGDEMRE